LKFVEDNSVLLVATLCKGVWLELYVAPYQEPDAEKIPHIHTIKFYQNWLKFIEDDSIWVEANLCKVMWQDLTIKYSFWTLIFWTSWIMYFSPCCTIWETNFYWVGIIIWLIVYYIMSWNVWAGLMYGGDSLEWGG